MQLTCLLTTAPTWGFNTPKMYPLMNPIQLFRPQTVLLLALAGSLFGIPLVAAAPLMGQPAQDPPTLIKHLRLEMRMKETIRQESALMDVVSLASCTGSCIVSLRSIQNKQIQIENDTESGSIVDLEALAPDLLKLYRRGSTDGLRLLALSALINVGNERAIEALVQGGTSSRVYRQSHRVNHVTQKALASFYLARYPELTERALRTKIFSLDDVQRVKHARVRAAKKAMSRS